MADGQVVIEIDGDASKYRVTLAEIKGQTDTAGKSMAAAAQDNSQRAASALGTVGRAASSIGKALTIGVTAPIIAIGGYSANAAMKFESSFAGVQKTVNATDEQFQQLSDSAREMAKTKPVDVNDVNLIMELGGQLGIATENLTGFADVVSDLDVATDLDVETASTELAQFMNITQTGQDKVSNLGSTLVALGNNSATTESSIMAMAMRIAGAGSQIGMTDDQILAMSAALSSVGIDAEAGGTAISTVLSQIDKDVATSSGELQVWAETAGMSVEDFKSAWQNDAATTMEAVFKGMSTSGENLNIVLDDMGVSSLRQTDMMKRMSNASGVLDSSLKTAADGWRDNNALTNEAQRRYGTTEGQIQILKNKANDLGIELGGPLLSALNDIIDDAQPLVDVLKNGAEAFASMDSEQQKQVMTLAAVAAAGGPAVSVLGKLCTAINQMAETKSKAADALSAISGGSSRAASASSSAASAAETQAAATEKAASSTKKMAAVSAVGKAAIAGLAIAGIAILVSEMEKSKERYDNFNKSTLGLEEAAGKAESAVSGQSGSIDALGSSAKNAAFDLDSFLKKQAGYADAINQTNSAAAANASMLNNAKAAIDEYAGKTDLSTEAQGRLRAAVELVNSQCGTQLKVTDAANGVVYDEATAANVASDAIDGYIQKKLQQIKTDALTQDLSEAYRAQKDAIDAVTSAQSDFNAKKAEYAALQDAAADGDEMASSALLGADQAYRTAQGNLDKAKSSLDSANGAVGSLTSQLGMATDAASGTADGFESFVSGSYTLTSAVNQAHGDLGDFQTDLKNTGVSVEQLKSLNDDQLRQLGLSYDGTSESISRTLSELGIECSTKGTQAAKAFADGIASGGPEAQLAAQGIGIDASTGLMTTDGRPGGQKVVDTFNAAVASGDTYSAAMGKASEAAGAMTADASPGGQNTAETFNAGEASVDTYGPAAEMAQDAVSGAGSVSAESSGENFSSGFAGGISNGIEWAKEAAANLAKSAWDALKQAGGEGSPWSTTRSSGRFAAQGLAVDISEEARKAVEASRAMASDVESAATADLTSLSPALVSRAEVAASSSISATVRDAGASQVVSALQGVRDEVAATRRGMGRAIAENAPSAVEITNTRQLGRAIR